MAVDGRALAMAVGGGVLLWTGLTSPKGNPRDVLSALLSGRPARKPSQVPAIAAQDAGASSAPGGLASVSTTGAAIASDAMTYKGHCYSYGGAPGADGKSCWDCSSFCNWVLGHDFGVVLPGGIHSYDGTSHGPSTLEYLLFGGAVSRRNVAAGDLCVYQTHMGIAISNTEMISAENPANGTQVSTIDGMTQSLGEVLFCRRVRIPVIPGPPHGVKTQLGA